MPKYLVMLRCSRARSNANRHRQETPAYLPYRTCHPCRDGSYGVADFLGFKFNNKEDTE